MKHDDLQRNYQTSYLVFNEPIVNAPLLRAFYEDTGMGQVHTRRHTGYEVPEDIAI